MDRDRDRTETDGGTARTLRVAAPPGTPDAEAVVEAAREAGAGSVVRTGPTGLDSVEPLVLATVGGQTAILANATPETAREAASALADGRLPTGAMVVEHDDTDALPLPDEGPLAVGRRRVLGPCGWVDPLDPAAVTAIPDARDNMGRARRLRGRGRGDAAADEPLGETWDTVRAAAGDPVVVVNANAADAVQRGDRTLLAGAPHAVFDGAAAVAGHIGASDVVVHLNGSDDVLVDHLRRAVDRRDGSPQLVAGPDAYRAGEPTATLEALEGADRVEPRLQPPGPATHGLYGRPTAVHTPRTLVQVRAALLDPDHVDPEADDPGTRLVTVDGDVAARATVELSTTATLAAAERAVEPTGEVAFACVGGRLGGFVETLDVPVTVSGLANAGLGTDGSVELFADDRCAVAEAGRRVRFAAEENSGRCVPGREGTVQLAELLRDVYDGSFEPGKIRELGRVMANSSNCLVGAHAPRPARTALEGFESTFRAHADGRCPSGACF